MERGFHTVGAQLVGMVGEYPVTVVYPAQRKVKYCSFTFMLESAPDKSERKVLQAECKPFADGVTIGKDIITLTFKGKANAPLAEKLSRLEEAADLLRRHNLYPPTQCSICKQGDADACLYHGQRFQPVHQSCAHDLKDSMEERAQSKDGSYLLGIIGAILGMLVGCIPNVLTIWFMDTIYAVLCALIPLCAFYGYKLLRGRMNWVATVVTIVLSLIGVLIMDIVLNGIYLSAMYDIPLIEATAFIFEILPEEGVLLDLILESGTAFLFVFLGILFVWRQITRTAKSELKELRTTMSTLTLMPGVAPLAPPAAPVPVAAEAEGAVYANTPVMVEEEL